MLFESDFDSTFASFDADKDGVITATEFKALMTSLGQELSDDAAGSMLAFIDADGDGKITRQELRDYLSAS